MKANNYLSYDENENEKCQCITFDENGKIMGSCDTLFTTSKLTVAGIKREFPFLWNIINYFKTNEKSNDPLFFPQVEFDNLPDLYDYPEQINQYPAHYFSHLFSLAACV